MKMSNENEITAATEEAVKQYRLEMQKEYRQKNSEKIRQYQKKWRQKNPEKIRQYQKKWRQKNPEKIRQYIKNYWRKKALEAGKITQGEI